MRTNNPLIKIKKKIILYHKLLIQNNFNETKIAKKNNKALKNITESKVKQNKIETKIKNNFIFNFKRKKNFHYWSLNSTHLVWHLKNFKEVFPIINS